MKRIILAIATLCSALVLSLGISLSPASAYDGCPGTQQTFRATHYGAANSHLYAFGGTVYPAWGVIYISTNWYTDTFDWYQRLYIHTNAYFIRSIYIYGRGSMAGVVTTRSWLRTSVWERNIYFNLGQSTVTPNDVIDSVRVCLEN